MGVFDDRTTKRQDFHHTAVLVQEYISSSKVVIFSKSYCPYCKMAKDVFDKMREKYTVIELDHRRDGEVMQDVLAALTGARTVPRVFVNGECIGGGTDVWALYESGKLYDYFK